jgi:hypothetical protein
MSPLAGERDAGEAEGASPYAVTTNYFFFATFLAAAFFTGLAATFLTAAFFTAGFAAAFFTTDFLAGMSILFFLFLLTRRRSAFGGMSNLSDGFARYNMWGCVNAHHAIGWATSCRTEPALKVRSIYPRSAMIDASERGPAERASPVSARRR